MIFSHERIDDLQIDGLKVIQDTRGFCFGVDSILLADFARVKRGDRLLDMCAGSGVIALLLSCKKPREVVLLELQPHLAQMAERSIRLNSLENVRSVEGDVRRADELFPVAHFDVITCNPPYFPVASGLLNPNEQRSIARHETHCTIEDIARSASRLLRFGGRLFIVHRAERLPDLIETMRRFKMEPKRLRMVQPSIHKPPEILLLECAHGGRPHLEVMPALCIN